MKKCNNCGESKLATKEFFHAEKLSKDGLRNECKVCKLEKTKQWYKNKGAEYQVWKGIKSRCYNPNEVGYKNYGGRGIIMCDRWIESYDNFFEDMGLRPSDKHTIDRIDNNGNYTPNNCKWSTYTEQILNRRPQSKHKGVYWYKQTNKWKAAIGINYKQITIGYYDNFEDAIEARKQAELKYHSEHMTP